MQERPLRAVQAQASTAEVAESQLTVPRRDTASLDPRTCIIRVVKDEHPERKVFEQSQTSISNVIQCIYSAD
jgi:hypothetical protein